MYDTWKVYSLLPTPLWPGVVVPVMVPSIGPNDHIKNWLYSLGPHAKKKLLRNNYRKNEHTNVW